MTSVALSQPVPTLDLTPGISGRLLYLVGGDDALIDAAQRKEIGAALDRAGVDHELVVYPGVEHAFFWPGTSAYDADATEDAWQRILDLLSQEPAG